MFAPYKNVDLFFTTLSTNRLSPHSRASYFSSGISPASMIDGLKDRSLTEIGIVKTALTATVSDPALRLGTTEACDGLAPMSAAASKAQSNMVSSRRLPVERCIMAQPSR